MIQNQCVLGLRTRVAFLKHVFLWLTNFNQILLDGDVFRLLTVTQVRRILFALNYLK